MRISRARRLPVDMRSCSVTKGVHRKADRDALKNPNGVARRYEAVIGSRRKADVGPYRKGTGPYASILLIDVVERVNA